MVGLSADCLAIVILCKALPDSTDHSLMLSIPPVTIVLLDPCQDIDNILSDKK